MTPADLVDTSLQGFDVEWSFGVQRVRNVVSIAFRSKTMQEPEALLGKGQDKRIPFPGVARYAAFDGGTCAFLVEPLLEDSALCRRQIRYRMKKRAHNGLLGSQIRERGGGQADARQIDCLKRHRAPELGHDVAHRRSAVGQFKHLLDRSVRRRQWIGNGINRWLVVIISVAYEAALRGPVF